MRRAPWLLVALALAAPTAHAGSTDGPADTTAVLDASLAATSALEARAERDSLARLAARIGRSPVRVTVGHDIYDLNRVVLDSVGIHFTEGGTEGEPLHPSYDATRISSPIPWERVSTIRVGHPHAWLGALLGATAGSLVVVHAIHEAHYDESGTLLAEIALVPLGALGGAGVGAVVGIGLTSWPIVWQRPPNGGGGR